MIKDTNLASSPNSGTSRSTTPSSTIYTPLSEASIPPTFNHSPPQITLPPPPRRPSPLNLDAHGARPSTRASVAATLHHNSSSSASAAPKANCPPMHHASDGRSGPSLLKDERGRPSYDSPTGSTRPTLTSVRRSTLSSRSPDLEAQMATRRRYTYAAFFLALSLVSFVVQTETAVYIQHNLGWNKAYCML